MRTPKSTSCASETCVPDVEAEMEMVEILRAVAVGPPETRMVDVQRGRVLWIEGDELGAVRSEFDGLLEGDVFDGALDHGRSAAGR